MHRTTNRPCKRERVSELTLDLFNACAQVGGEVIYERVKGDESTRSNHPTKSEAFMLSGHTPCVRLEGVRGAVALRNVYVPKATVDQAKAALKAR